MRRKGPQIDTYYSKSKEYPVVRYAKYWNIPIAIVAMSYRLYFVDGESMGDIMIILRIVKPDFKRHRFQEFVRACNKYHECKQNNKTLLTQLPSRRASKNADFRTKAPSKLAGFAI